MARRRIYGSGTITRRANGKWQAQIRVDGKRLSKTFQFRHDAVRWLQEQEYSKVGADVGITLTVGELLDRWLDVVKDQNAQKTYDSYKGLVDRYVRDALGDINIRTISVATLDNFFQELRKHFERKASTGQIRGNGSRTRLGVYQVLHICFNYAVKKGWMDVNPMRRVDRPVYRKGEAKFLTAAQARQLLRFVEGDVWWETLLWVAISTGMREGELLGLTWEYVDLPRNMI